MLQERKLTIEDLIRLDLLSRGEEHRTVEQIFDEVQPVASWDSSKAQLLLKLKTGLSNGETFGELLKREIESKRASVEALTRDSGMPEKTLSSLVNDSLFPFSVPVMVFRSLIVRLGLDANRALQAIRLTGEILAELIDDVGATSHSASITARREQMSAELRKSARGVTTRRSALDSNAVYLERLREALGESK